MPSSLIRPCYHLVFYYITSNVAPTIARKELQSFTPRKQPLQTLTWLLSNFKRMRRSTHFHVDNLQNQDFFWQNQDRISFWNPGKHKLLATIYTQLLFFPQFDLFIGKHKHNTTLYEANTLWAILIIHWQEMLLISFINHHWLLFPWFLLFCNTVNECQFVHCTFIS